ncbi:MAG: HMA2 domain-containing protein [Candidatus Binatia bacterium]
MDVEGVRVVHAMPGRVRLKISQVKKDAILAEDIQRQLSAVQGIQRVETNPLTGSVLVLYDSEELVASESLHALPDLLSRFFPGLDASELTVWMSSPRNGAESGPPLAQSITTLFGTWNAQLEQTTGGLDLKVFFPLTLFLLGIRGLFVSEKVVFPTWYDLLWFSFGTFVMLNRSVVDGNK